ncbi:MAG: hypothetical protein ACLFO5_03765 [Opitutales bacterium]
MFENTVTPIEWALLTGALFAVLLPILGSRTGMPVFVLLGRWVRWFLFAGLFAFFIKYFELSYRPDWVHFLTGLALWFLLETGYNWIAIKAISYSDLPLFPNFEENNEGDEWPADDRLIKLRDWLRKQGYTRLKALKATLFEEMALRASIYESKDRLTRIQILFIPKKKGGATACYAITTYGEEERRIITDNFFLPFGGYYPEGWQLCRKPLIGSLKRLLRLHAKRVKKSDITPVPCEQDPLTEINRQQLVLERLNLDTGFLVAHQHREEEGKISPEGRYRLWKEMWLIAYLGKPVT